MIMTGVQIDVIGEKIYHCHSDDHKFHKDRNGNETHLHQKTPGVWQTAWAMVGPSHVIFSYHVHLCDKLAQIF